MHDEDGMLHDATHFSSNRPKKYPMASGQAGIEKMASRQAGIECNHLSSSMICVGQEENAFCVFYVRENLKICLQISFYRTQHNVTNSRKIHNFVLAMER